MCICMGRCCSGKYTKDNLPKGPRGVTITADRVAEVQPLLSLMRDIGSAHGGKTPGQVCLKVQEVGYLDSSDISGRPYVTCRHQTSSAICRQYLQFSNNPIYHLHGPGPLAYSYCNICPKCIPFGTTAFTAVLGHLLRPLAWRFPEQPNIGQGRLEFFHSLPVCRVCTNGGKKLS